MEIREIGAAERASVSLPIQAYAFQASPADDQLNAALEHNQAFYEENLTLVAEENGVALADASAVSMQQNVRGVIYPMAGVAGVATLPEARRRGHASALVRELLGRMSDAGHVMSSLYPFRPSFYARFGFVGMPGTRMVTFSPTAFSDLLRAELPGEVTRATAAEGYPAYRALIERLLRLRHGFSLLPEYRTVELKGARRWIAVAWADGEPVAATTYQISGFGAVLRADDLLTVSPVGRALLLRFFAAHTDQVDQVEAQVAPDELPELWATDLAAVTQATTSYPASPAPMARVLSLSALAGLPTGQARVIVDVTGDAFIGGGYVLEGRSGVLEVTPVGTGTATEATLTAAGLSALVYGALDPEDIVVRGLGVIPADPAARLRRLFPRQVPYLYSHF